jgi:sulfonate transport system substrate-binding protein
MTTASKPVQLWYTRCGSATASALAIRKNWLQEEFATPETELLSLRESSNPDIRNSHFHHGQSGMFREGGNIPPIWARSNGQDTVVVGITWLDEYQGVLVRADSPIQTPADLRGRRLAIPRHPDALIDFQRGAAQHGFTTALAQAGLTPADAEFVDIEIRANDPNQGTNPPGDHPTLQALERGEVDAVFIRYARGYRVSKDSRFRQLLNIFDLPEPLQRVNNGTPRPITVDRAFLDKHPELVVRYLSVLLRTAKWAEKHRDEVAQLLLPESGGETVEDVFASHGADVHLSFTPKLTPAYISGLEAQKNFLRDWGYLKDDFDVHQWIVHEPLQQAQRLVAAEAAQEGLRQSA